MPLTEGFGVLFSFGTRIIISIRWWHACVRSYLQQAAMAIVGQSREGTVWYIVRVGHHTPDARHLTTQRSKVCLVTRVLFFGSFEVVTARPLRNDRS